MKHLKLFESKEFNIGDVVLFINKYATDTKTNSYGNFGWDWKYPKKIGEIIKWQAGLWLIEDDGMEYHVPTSRVLNIATDKDKEELKFQNQINKYNL